MATAHRKEVIVARVGRFVPEHVDGRYSIGTHRLNKNSVERAIRPWIRIITRMVSINDCTFVSSKTDGSGRLISRIGMSKISLINAEWMDVGSLDG